MVGLAQYASGRAGALGACHRRRGCWRPAGGGGSASRPDPGGKPAPDRVRSVGIAPLLVVVAASAPASAVSGAINIVLRDRFDGVEVEFGREIVRGAGGNTEQGSVLLGGPLGAGHILFGADVFRRDSIRGADRDYSRSSWTPGGSFADATHVSVAGNTALLAGPGGRLIGAAAALGPCEGNGYTGPLQNPYGFQGEGCGFAAADFVWRWEQRERRTAFFAFDHPAGEDRSLYVEARAADTEFTRPYLPPAADTTVLGANRVGLAPGSIVFHRFAGHGDRAWHSDIREHDLTLGLDGRLGSRIGYDVHVRTHQFRDAMDAGTFVWWSALDAEIGLGGRYDLADPLSTDPDHLAAIRDTSVRLDRGDVTKHRAVRAAFDGTGIELGGGPLGWAAGAELVYESREWDPVLRDATGRVVDARDVIGSFDFDRIAFSAERERLSKFAEIQLPLRADWDVVVAGRHDEQNDVGSTVSGQVASSYRLNDGLSLRSSWSRAEKPPILVGLNAAQIITNPFIFDPQTELRYPVTAVNSGNPELEPDEAESVSLGVVSRHGPVSLSGDWYRTRVSGALAVVTAQTIIDYAENNPLPDDVHIIRYPDARRFAGCPEDPLLPLPGVISCIVKPVTGDGELEITGINVRAQVGWSTDWAEFDLEAHWSHVTDYEIRAFDIREPEDFPRNRIHAVLGITRGDVTAQWTTYGISDYRVAGGRFGGWVGHDLAVRWSNVLGYDGTALTAGIINFRDHGPPLHSEYPEYADETFDSIRGRTFFVTFRRSW